MEQSAVLFRCRRSFAGDRCRSVSGRSTLRKLAVLTIGTVALLGVALGPPDHPARSQAARTIRVIISVPPGGSIDLLVRILADYISSAKGQSIIVESRPGAGGIIAAEAVARAAPDGTDRKSTRLNSSHLGISYAVFCLKKKKHKKKEHSQNEIKKVTHE